MGPGIISGVRLASAYGLDAPAFPSFEMLQKMKPARGMQGLSVRSNRADNRAEDPPFLVDRCHPNVKLSKSRWFTRGWTLQELIAPARIRFYDKSWISIGTKNVLSQKLSLITGIDTAEELIGSLVVGSSLWQKA